MKSEYNQTTHLVFDGGHDDRHFGAVVPPIYQNSLFTFDSWEAIELAFEDKSNTPIYTRGVNPSVQFVEDKLAKLAQGDKAKLFASGMAAVSASLLHFMQQGEHMILLNNSYGPTASLVNTFMIPKMGIQVTYVSGTDIAEFEAAIQPNTRVIYLESPSSVVFSLQDICAVTDMAKQHGIKTILDNSWATPIFQKPLTMGVDLEVHSCSKYLAGHSDIVAGVVIGDSHTIDAIHHLEYELLGAKFSPLEASLLLRSLRTLELRMQRHSQSAMSVARFLSSHPKVTNVFYPGLKTFPQYDLAKKQMSGFSGLLSFQLNTKNLEQIKTFFNCLVLFQKGVSWGGHESLIYAPAISCLKEQSPEQMEKMGISLGDMRLSIGLENVEDLINDLTLALDTITL